MSAANRPAVTHLLVIDFLGRPTTNNRAHNMHHRAVSKDRKLWREAGCVLARAAKIPAYTEITIEAWGRYPDRRSWPDVDGLAPAVKGAIDGLVDAGVIPNDTYQHLSALTYRVPVLGADQPPALCLRITPTLDGAG